MDDDTKSAISQMQSAASLHEGRQDSGASSESENAQEAETPSNSKFGLVIDDSKLEKTIYQILDRIGALEQRKTNEEVAALQQRSERATSPISVDNLVAGLSDRLNKIEAMIESSEDEPGADLISGGGAGRPSTSEGDKRMALTNQAFSIAQNEASKEHPSIPTITRTIFKELTAMSARVKRFEDSISQSMAFQDQKDKAQDELLAMEIQRIDEDIRRRVDHKALDKLGNRFKGEFENIRRDFEDKLDRQAMKITNEIGRGVRTLRDQVKVINEANRDIMDQLDARIKNLEKTMNNEMEELETRTRELIEETVYLAVSELRASTDGKFAEAHDKLNTIFTDVASVTKKQEEMVVGSAGETTRLSNDIANVEAKFREMFDEGGVAAMIEAGSKPAILELDRKLDAEIVGIQATVTSVTEVAEAGRKALADKLKAETEDIRRIMEEDIKQDMGELNEGISRLASSTSDQLSHLNDGLEKQSTELSHQCAMLNESLGRANQDIVETKSFLKIFDDRLTEYQVTNGERLVQAEQRISPLEEAAKAAQEAAAALAERAGENEKYASSLREAITKCEEDIVAGQHSVVRVSDESRAHRRAIDVHLQALSEEMTTRLTEDRNAIVSLEAKTAHGEALCQELKDSFATLVTKESFWDVMEKRTKWHAERLAKHCNDTEAATSAADAPKLSPEAVKHMSGHSQRIAKIIASQADAAVLKEMVGGGVPAATELPTLAKLWDELVDERRQFLLDEFIRRVEQVARRGRPKSLSDDHYSAEARSMFLATTRLSLRLALSKFARILPSETMLGVRGLAAANGSCAACSRPFGRDPGPGDRRAGNPEEFSTVSRRKKQGSQLGDEEEDGTSYGGAGSSIGGSTATSRNPFKQSATKKTRYRSGRDGQSPNTLMSSSIGSGGVKVGNLQLGSIGEWEDDGSVSSIASGVTRQSELLGMGSREGGPVTFPPV